MTIGSGPADRSTGRAPLESIRIPLEAALEARLVRRYKRFLADVRLKDGRELTVHCPNPGRMLGTDTPGSRVRCSTSADPRRKLRHTLELIEVDGCWVGLHAARANQIAAAILEADGLPAVAGFDRIEREVAAPEGSRFDFRLARSPAGSRTPRTAIGSPDGGGEDRCWLEVKSVTLCSHGRARFPDAVSERGRRHLAHLSARVAAGDRAVLLFVAQRGDAESVAPADDIDPAYGRALRAAAEAGVELFAVGTRIEPTGITVARPLPVLL